MEPIISIIIATFNAAKTLRNCLDSIVLQKNEFIELLVIDGGSTDGTQAVLSEYGSQIDLIISEQDSGIYDAWNKGIANAHGEWILFIGADDTLEADAFAKYFSFLDKHDTTEIDYICAKNTYVGKNGQVLKVFGVPWRWEQFRRTMQVAHVASLHKHKLFNEVGSYDLKFRICGDIELLLRKQKNLRCLFLDSCIARMAIGGTSYSVKVFWEGHQIRRLHSQLSSLTLITISAWKLALYLRHRLLHRNI
jgi:glycosyltransferase involved in cell wall biosynthesis